MLGFIAVLLQQFRVFFATVDDEQPSSRSSSKWTKTTELAIVIWQAKADLNLDVASRTAIVSAGRSRRSALAAAAAAAAAAASFFPILPATMLLVLLSKPFTVLGVL